MKQDKKPTKKATSKKTTKPANRTKTNNRKYNQTKTKLKNNVKKQIKNKAQPTDSYFIYYIFTAIIILALSYTGYSYFFDELTFGKNTNQTAVVLDGQIEVHFIDVGQGDATLIKTPSGNMLIDAGDIPMENRVVSYLQNEGIQKIDYLVATHPHADHIGGMPGVINSFDIGTMMMPERAHTSRIFERMLDALEENEVDVIPPVVGNRFELGDAVFTVLAPSSDGYNNLNDYSIVLIMDYGNTSFVFTGDAEAISEVEILDTGFDIRADVLGVGHHGSSTSTTLDFLEAIDPTVAVISVGHENRYNHPNSSVIERLENYGVDIYRTDQSGHIVMVSDGEKIEMR